MAAEKERIAAGFFDKGVNRTIIASVNLVDSRKHVTNMLPADFVLVKHHADRAAFFGDAAFGSRREEAFLFFAVMAFVRKVFDEVDRVTGVGNIEFAGLIGPFGHFFQGGDDDFDNSMFLHENVCRFHEGLLSIIN
jgi:hypothetical protein